MSEKKFTTDCDRDMLLQVNSGGAIIVDAVPSTIKLNPEEIKRWFSDIHGMDINHQKITDVAPVSEADAVANVAASVKADELCLVCTANYVSSDAAHPRVKEVYASEEVSKAFLEPEDGQSLCEDHGTSFEKGRLILLALNNGNKRFDVHGCHSGELLITTWLLGMSPQEARNGIAVMTVNQMKIIRAATKEARERYANLIATIRKHEEKGLVPNGQNPFDPEECGLDLFLTTTHRMKSIIDRAQAAMERDNFEMFQNRVGGELLNELIGAHPDKTDELLDEIKSKLEQLGDISPAGSIH